MKPDEIRKVQTYMRNTFKSPELEVRARPRKDDSAEVISTMSFSALSSAMMKMAN